MHTITDLLKAKELLTDEWKSLDKIIQNNIKDTAETHIAEQFIDDYIKRLTGEQHALNVAISCINARIKDIENEYINSQMLP